MLGVRQSAERVPEFSLRDATAVLVQRNNDPCLLVGYELARERSLPIGFIGVEEGLLGMTRGGSLGRPIVLISANGLGRQAVDRLLEHYEVVPVGVFDIDLEQ